MKQLDGRTAFITGGAGGFGLALARRFGAAGMKIMLADIDVDAVGAAVEGLRSSDYDADGLVCDVTERASMQAAATRTQERFGRVHLLCNNAGVVVSGPVDTLLPSDWEWVFAVNVMGVVNGIAAFLPGMRAHGEVGHILNTGSIAGLKGMPFSGVYCASKAAVVALSESLRAELADTPIGVTVLCPSFMKTGFFSSGDKRQDRYGGAGDIWEKAGDAVKSHLTAMLEAGHTPDAVAALAVQAIMEDRALVVSNGADEPMIAERLDGIRDAFRRLEPVPSHA